MADFSSTVLCFYSERNTQRRGGRLASIKKRDDGRYRARYRDTSGREHAKHFVKKTDAQRWLDEVTTSIVSGNYADPKRGRQLFHDFALEWAAAQDWKDTTRDGFPRVLVRAEKVLPEHVRLDQIDQLVIMRARVDLGKTYAPAAVALTMTYLLAIMRAAFITRRVSADATIGARSRRRRRDAERVGPDKVPTRAEVAAIWNAAPAPYRAAIALGSAGLRIGEVLGLTADRIDLDERSVLIDRQLQRIGNEMQFTTPKGEKARTIRLPSAVALELRRHLREHTDRDVLFRGLRGTRTCVGTSSTQVPGDRRSSARDSPRTASSFTPCGTSPRRPCSPKASTRWPSPAISATRSRHSIVSTHTGCATTATSPPTRSSESSSRFPIPRTIRGPRRTPKADPRRTPASRSRDGDRRTHGLRGARGFPARSDQYFSETGSDSSGATGWWRVDLYAGFCSGPCGPLAAIHLGRRLPAGSSGLPGV
jgi:integrase